MYLPQELIAKKRDALELSSAEIHFLIEAISCNRLSDAQVGAFAMAVFFNDMSTRECAELTCAMRDSGEVLSWADAHLDGPVLDKHSTGGVGDLVSLVLGPIVAACGGYVPMISGRGLGHTGGTLDKLESIRGYRVNPPRGELIHALKQAGVAIIGADANIAPADKRLYAIRDVTATVDSMALICASILSKKLAAGLDSLVMDVKLGSGAFMPTAERSRQLAERIVAVANQAGCRTSALLTDMNQPLASSAGNALEVMEAMDYLSGSFRNARLHQVVMALAETMLVNGALADSHEQARRKISQALDSGEAAERFNRMVRLLGGPADLLAQGKAHFDKAPVIAPLLATQDGYLSAINTREIGMSVVALGGGRVSPEQAVDHRVGLNRWRQLGEQVHIGEPLVMIHAADQNSWQQAAERISAAITICQQPPNLGAVVDSIIEPNERRNDKE